MWTARSPCIAANVSALSLLDTGLTNNTRYYYRVRAFAPGGTSDMSAKVSVTPLEAPPADCAGKPRRDARQRAGRPDVDAVAGATSYRVFRTTTGVFDRTPIATVTTPDVHEHRVDERDDVLVPDCRRATRAATVRSPRSCPQRRSPRLRRRRRCVATGGDRQITLKWAAVARRDDLQRLSRDRGRRAGDDAGRLGLDEPGLRRHDHRPTARPTTTRSPLSTSAARARARRRPTPRARGRRAVVDERDAGGVSPAAPGHVGSAAG